MSGNTSNTPAAPLPAAPRGEPWLLFALMFLVYAATSPGHLVTDSAVRFGVAEQLLATGWVAVPADFAQATAAAPDGRHYVIWGMGQSLCFVPFVLAGKALAGLGLGSADVLGEFLASITLFPLFGALAVLLVYGIVRDATHDARAARWVALLFGLATMHWQHTVNTMEESQVATAGLLALFAMQRAWQTDRWRWRLVVLVAMGVAISFRYSAVVICAPLGIVGFLIDLARRDAGARLNRCGQWLLAGLVGLAPLLVALGWFNYARFNDAFETGYAIAYANGYGGRGMFATPLWTGLNGMLLSPGKSVFVYNPILLLAVIGWPLLLRKHAGLAWVVLTTFAAMLLFHARFTVWAGDLTWGPRYLASVLGFAMLGLVPLVPRSSAPPRRFAFGALLIVAGVSVVIQLASVTYSLGLEYFQDRRKGLIPGEYIWDWRDSQVVLRFENIARQLAGHPNHHSIPPTVVDPELHQTPVSDESVARVHVLSIFPFKGYATTGNRKLFLLMLALWIAMLFAAGGLAWTWHRRIRRIPEPRAARK